MTINEIVKDLEEKYNVPIALASQVELVKMQIKSNKELIEKINILEDILVNVIKRLNTLEQLTSYSDLDF